jgi:hypothetical protein
MKYAVLIAVTGLLVAAEKPATEPPANAPTKSTSVSVRATVVVAPRYYVPYRYSGYGLLGNLIGAGIRTGLESWREKKQNERIAQESPAPYVYQVYEPALTEMIIESNPPGAFVSINGQPVGVTPQTRLEKPGAVYMLIRADGYDDFIHDFTAGGAPVHVIAELKHQPNHAESNVIVIK